MKTFLTFLFVCLFISGTKAQDYDFGDVSKEEILEKSHPVDQDADAAVLYRQQRTYYELSARGFVLVTDVQERIKIYSKDGFSWATKEIRRYENDGAEEQISGLKGFTYNIKDGEVEKVKLRDEGVFEEEVDENNEITRLTMPAVTEGSVIEYKYQFRSPFVISIDRIPLQYTIPINRLEMMIRIPEYLVFKKHFNPRASVFFKLTEHSSNQMLTLGNSERISFLENEFQVNADDIPALENENYLDNLNNYAAFLDFELQLTRFPESRIETYTSTWEDVVDAIYKEGGVTKELGRDFYEAELDLLLRGAVHPEEKMNRIFGFVKNKIKWNGNRGILAEEGVKDAYKLGSGNVGDINLLLIGMLQSAGIQANPVVMSTKDNGIPLFPTREGFNYVIAHVQLPGKSMLLDASEKNSAPGELPRRARNWQGRLIKSDGTSEWVNLMPTSASEEAMTINYKFDEQLVVQGKTRSIFDGFFAKQYRDKYQEMTSDAYREFLEKQGHDLLVSNVEKKDVELVGEQINETYDFELKNAVEHIGGKIYLKPLLFAATEENPFKAEKRTHPIFFDFPSRESKTANIMVPEGYKVEYLPESEIFELNNGAGRFRFLTSQNGSFLRIQVEVEINQIAFNSEEYLALKTFFQKIVEKQAETIVLTKV